MACQNGVIHTENKTVATMGDTLGGDTGATDSGNVAGGDPSTEPVIPYAYDPAGGGWPEQSGGIPVALSSLPTGSWVRLFACTYADASAGTAPHTGLLAYSGMALDERRQLLLLAGGGHTDSSSNTVWGFDLNTSLWRPAYPSDSFGTMTLEECLANVDNVNFPGMWLPSHRPISRHTYGSNIVTPEEGLMFLGGGSTYSGPNGVGTQFWNDVGNPGGCWPNSPHDTWAYDPGMNHWHYLGNTYGQTPGNIFSASAYDPVTKKVLTASSSFDPKTGTFSPHAADPFPVGAEPSVTLARTRRQLFLASAAATEDRTPRLHVYDIAADSWKELPDQASSTASAYSLTGGYALSFDEMTDQLVVMGGLSEGQTFLVDPDSGAWSSRDGLSVHGADRWHQPHGLLKYSPTWNVHLYVTTPADGLVDVWALRLSD